MGYVYVIDFGDRIKIGMTTNVNKRLSNLQTQSGCVISQKYFLEFSNYKEIEKRMHNIFKDYRCLGEYFTGISFDIIVEELDKLYNTSEFLEKARVSKYKLSNNKKFMKKWIDRKISKLITSELRDVDLGFLYKIEPYIDDENIVDFKRFKLDYGYTDSKLSKSKKPLLETGILRENNTLIYLNPLVGIIGKEISQELIEIFSDTFEKYNVSIKL